MGPDMFKHDKTRHPQNENNTMFACSSGMMLIWLLKQGVLFSYRETGKVCSRLHS